MFSTEDLLDKKIATDPFLYEVYLECLKEVLETLSPDVLKQVIQKTYAELYPFYRNEEIISNAQFDYYRDTGMGTFRIYLSEIYLSLINFRTSYLRYLDNRDD